MNLPRNTHRNENYRGPSGNGALRWGSPYAIVLNTSVRNSEVMSDTIIAANAVTGDNRGAVSATNIGSENDQIAYSPNTDDITTYGYDFERTRIERVETVTSDLVKVTFNKPILNSNDEIRSRVEFVQAGMAGIGGGLVNFAQYGSSIDVDGTSTRPIDENGDPIPRLHTLRSFYMKLPSTNLVTASWRSDAVGSSVATTALNNGLGGSNSRDARGRPISGRISNTVPNINFVKGTFFGSNGADFAIADGIGNDNSFTDTTDGTGPVLYEILVGRAGSTSDRTENHNYFKLRYSEPLAFGDTDGGGAEEAIAGLRL